jgi:hypothetical protein
MEIKSNITLEVTKNERLYQFIVPVGAPFGEAVDVAFENFVKISEMAQENFNKAKEDREKAVKEAAEKEGEKETGLR